MVLKHFNENPVSVYRCTMLYIDLRFYDWQVVNADRRVASHLIPVQVTFFKSLIFVLFCSNNLKLRPFESHNCMRWHCMGTVDETSGALLVIDTPPVFIFSPNITMSYAARNSNSLSFRRAGRSC